MPFEDARLRIEHMGREIAGIGNILRHDYDGVDDSVIWNLVRNDLEPLRTALQALLGEAGGC